MGWRRPPHPWVSGHSTRRGLCSFTSGQEMNPFYSISNFSLFVYITLFNVYCQTDRFLLKVYLLPPSLAVCPGWGRGSWCGGGRFSPGIPPGPGSGAEAFARAVAASAGTVAAARSCPFRCCALRPPGGAAAGRRAGRGGGGPQTSRRASRRPGRWGAEWPPPFSAGTAPPPSPWAGSPGEGNGVAAAIGLARARGSAIPSGGGAAWRGGVVGNKGRRRARPRQAPGPGRRWELVAGSEGRAGEGSGLCASLRGPGPAFGTPSGRAAEAL